MQVNPPTNPPHPAISEIVQSELEAVGLNMEITQSTSFVTDAARLKPDLAFVFINPPLFAIAFENTGTALNVCGWKNPEAVSLLTATRDGSKTEAETQAAWDSFQKILLDESPVVYTVTAPLLSAHSDKVKGLNVTASGAVTLGSVYMVK